MFISRDRTSKALVLFGAITLIVTACDADGAAPNGGEEPWSGADASADVTVPADQFNQSEIMGPVDVLTDLAIVDVPVDLATVDAPGEESPPVVDAVEEITVPGPADLQTATFALG
jgi:hypothetical protein